MSLLEAANKKIELDLSEGFDPTTFSLHSEVNIDPNRHLGTVWKVINPLAQGADAVATVVVLHKLKGTVRESNPLLAPLVGKSIVGDAAFIAGKVALGAGASYLGSQLALSNHKTMAKVFLGLGGALGFGAAAYNVSHLGK